MESFTDNPFAALTIVVAPAILTNASSILCLGTANRLARVVDRTRVVSAQLAHLASNGENRVAYERQRHDLDSRWNLVLKALRFFYVSVGSFAAAALLSLLGSILSVSTPHIGFTATALVGLLSGTVGVSSLVVGCTMMVREARLAVHRVSASGSS
jgi:hypothetical protein